MSAKLYRYQFEPEIQAQEVEETLHLAVLAAECLHGQSRVRLDASYFMDTEKRICVINAGTDVGRDIVRIFTGFAIREFGETAFTVRRVDRAPRPETKEGRAHEGH
ncbi:MAG: hypothetical protein E3J72_18730 [Planctomycetota bacterium]|nr:MAG: hypothetical protein E3J72_18730 [Planctomycetota bacterium]